MTKATRKTLTKVYKHMNKVEKLLFHHIKSDEYVANTLGGLGVDIDNVIYQLERKLK